MMVHFLWFLDPLSPHRLKNKCQLGWTPLTIFSGSVHGAICTIMNSHAMLVQAANILLSMRVYEDRSPTQYVPKYHGLALNLVTVFWRVLVKRRKHMLLIASLNVAFGQKQ